MIRGKRASGKRGTRLPLCGHALRHDLAACLLLAAVCTLFFWPALAGRVLLPAEGLYLIDPVFTPYKPPEVPDPMDLTMVADLVGQMYVWRQFTVNSLRAGHLPLWNPYSACGMPFLANDQSAVLNPTNLLLNLLLSPPRAQTAFGLFCLLAACIFTYGLVRSLGGTALGGILGGLTFGFGGFVLVWLGFPLAATAIVLPAVLWATHRLLLKPTLTSAVILGLLIGWQFLSGHLSTSLQILEFWAVFVAYEIISRWRARTRWSPARAAGAIALALALGAGLGAPQLLPLREYVGLSRLRAHGRSRWASDGIADSARNGLLGNRWFLANIARGEIALLFLPERHGNPAFGDYRPHPSYGNYPERTSYVGVLALLALLSGLVWRPPPGHRRFFLIAAWLTFGLLLYLPILNLINCLPIVKLVAPQRLRFVFALCAAVSLGLAVSEWLPPPDSPNRPARGRLWLAALALALLCAAVGGLTVPLLRRPGAAPLPPPVALLRILKLFAPAISAAALGPLLLPSFQRRLGPRPVALALLLLALFDLFLFGAGWHRLSRLHTTLPELPPIRTARELTRTTRIAGPPNVFRPNLSVGYGIYDARSYDPLAVDRFLRLVEAFHGQAGASPWLQQGSEQPVPALYRLMSVGRIWHIGPAGDTTLCWCSHALPRAYVTDRVRASTADAALHALTGGLDPRRQTLLEGVSLALPTTNGFLHTAPLVSYRPHRVVARARAERPCWLVLTDTYYPGWRASVNGRPASLSLANYAFRAVPIPSGESSVTFGYEPASYRVGLFLALLSITGILALLTTQMLRRARQC